ncbi:desmethyl-deoxy-podophyllotoxin synthase-like [Lolium rigidum]|uniref:desmethyl-deoxy-podophyllotoxin synthase-like n=1 Tax=Lolium rigidum TaxID=89674 RepID=UPI001F5C502C|nr:desmethyl-deoxy-podophyllotoxin synthase-like [Lolium rigidum]
MEEWFSLCLVALLTLLAISFLKLLSARNNRPKKQLPPGPWTLPIIGSLHHVVSVLPHRTMADLSRRHGPLMHLRLGEVPTLVVSNAEVAALVMKTNDLAFAGRPRSATQEIFGSRGRDIAFAPYGEPWRQMRKVCVMELLGSKQARRAEAIKAEEVGNLVRSIAAAASAGATVNVSQLVTALSNDVVCRAVFGGKFARQEEFIRELHQAMELVAGFCLVDLFPSWRLARWLSNGERRLRRSHGRIERIIADTVQERKAARAARGGDCCTDEEDLLGVLLRLQREDSLEFPLTTEIIGAVLFVSTSPFPFDVFAGGTITTATILEWAMSELVNNPKAMAKAQLEIRVVLGEDRAVITNCDIAELQYLRMVIKEAFRLHPPFPLVPRRAREDCTVMGYDMLKDTNVLVNIFAISRDPRSWKNPEEFEPERFENNIMDYYGAYFELIPFGAGRRQCPGMLFSTSTVHITLANLLYHFDWMLPDGDSLASFDMSEKFGLTVNRRNDLQLRAIPHAGFKATPSK